MVKKPAKLEPNQVWTAKSLKRYRTVKRLYEGTVVYTTNGGNYRHCLLRTFRRWIYTHDAKRTQRGRRRALNLKG